MLIDFDKYTAIIESRLRPERFKHSLNVADCAAKLAEKYGVQIALETHNAANLDMYRHYGFELFDSFSGELPLREYCLVRKPKGDKEE